MFVLWTRSVCWFSVDPQCYWFLELDGYKEYGVWLIINQEMYPLYIHIMITSKVNQWKNSICMTIVQMWQTAWCVLALCQKMNVDRCYKYWFLSPVLYIRVQFSVLCQLWECFEVCLFVQIKNESCNIVQYFTRGAHSKPELNHKKKPESVIWTLKCVCIIFLFTSHE